MLRGLPFNINSIDEAMEQQLSRRPEDRFKKDPPEFQNTNEEYEATLRYLDTLIDFWWFTVYTTSDSVRGRIVQILRKLGLNAGLELEYPDTEFLDAMKNPHPQLSQTSDHPYYVYYLSAFTGIPILQVVHQLEERSPVKILHEAVASYNQATKSLSQAVRRTPEGCDLDRRTLLKAAHLVKDDEALYLSFVIISMLIDHSQPHVTSHVPIHHTANESLEETETTAYISAQSLHGVEFDVALERLEMTGGWKEARYRRLRKEARALLRASGVLIQEAVMKLLELENSTSAKSGSSSAIKLSPLDSFKLPQLQALRSEYTMLLSLDLPQTASVFRSRLGSIEHQIKELKVSSHQKFTEIMKDLDDDIAGLGSTSFTNISSELDRDLASIDELPETTETKKKKKKAKKPKKKAKSPDTQIEQSETSQTQPSKVGSLTIDEADYAENNEQRVMELLSETEGNDPAFTLVTKFVQEVFPEVPLSEITARVRSSDDLDVVMKELFLERDEAIDWDEFQAPSNAPEFSDVVYNLKEVLPEFELEVIDKVLVDCNDDSSLAYERLVSGTVSTKFAPTKTDLKQNDIAMLVHMTRLPAELIEPFYAKHHESTLTAIDLVLHQKRPKPMAQRSRVQRGGMVRASRRNDDHATKALKDFYSSNPVIQRSSEAFMWKALEFFEGDHIRVMSLMLTIFEHGLWDSTFDKPAVPQQLDSHVKYQKMSDVIRRSQPLKTANVGLKYRQNLEKADRDLVQSQLTRFQTKFILDLHGLTVVGAIRATLMCLNKWWQTELNSRNQEGRLDKYGGKAVFVDNAIVITGRGLHSAGGVARIKVAVKQYLDRNRFIYEEDVGRYVVSGLRRR